jgi:hypothetical protein
MPEFIYVQGKTIDVEDGGIEFQHERVTAPDASTAYVMGQRLAADTKFVKSKKIHEVINDYVVEL